MLRIFGYVEWAERWIAYCATIGIVLAVLWGVLTRYVTAKPAVWTSELSGILFTWVVFVGAATAFRENRHIYIDLFLGLLPASGQRIVAMTARLLTLAFLTCAAFLSYQMMIKGATRPSPVLRIPFSLVYLAPLLSFSLMALTDLLRLTGIDKTAGPMSEGDVL
ncbi:TRAP transporter small permease [Paracoccus sp. Z330]|uniref:TRAP transporter small permease protein n=1 Tax=Paracoccus onchidii TaxID=3017813 RepID=A0ABT4ZJW8_9RHOB|nr:TRAP transporter small permease [Paracoccus onchidii]MDB6179273.1 TRAP transporter small permease [Paracoccus onchidii]